MVLERHDRIASRPLVPRDLPIPEPGKGEIRLKVHACAICRTDLHIIEGDLPTAKLPVIPGHQVVGSIDAIGPGVGTEFRLGLRVGVAWLRHTCGVCRYCVQRRENLCEQSRFTGYHENGGFAEYMVAPAAYCYFIPPTFGDEEATPLLCAGIIGYRALERAALPPNGKLGIWGFGSSAHVVIQIARHRGARVFVSTRDERHRHSASDMGAAWVGPATASLPEKVDSGIIFAPAGELVPVALGNLEKGGTLALAGIYMTTIPPLDYTESLFFERNLHSVTANTRDDGRKLMAEAAKIPLRPKITTYSLIDANQALEDLENDAISGTGVLVPDDMMRKEP